MDRAEAIFYIKELQKTYASMDKKVAEAVDMAIEALSEERAGEWIEHDPKTKGLAKIYECPFCGDEVIGEKTNFCPNCGTEMGGDTE